MVRQIIAEATDCDFKVALETKKPKSWLKSVSAFANGIGGILLFGVADNKEIVGLENIKEDAEKISRLIKERITPLPQFILTPMMEQGKNILTLSVAAGRTTPYYYKADGIMEAYIRIGNETVATPDYILNELILKATNIFCTRWNGTEKGSIFDDALDDKEYEGNLIYLLQSGCDFVRNNSKVRFVKEARYRVDKPDYAERAVTEALVNALIHRDYIVLGSEIHIDMYDDRIEIQSPGGMFEGMPVQECDIEAIGSVRRNPVIADLFHRMKYMERRGSGLKKIVSETEKLPGYTPELRPEFFSTSSDFRVILKNVNFNLPTCTVQDRVQDERIVNLLEFCSEARTRQEMQDFIGMTSREHFRKSILKPLLETGKISMTLPNKPNSKNQKYIKV